jgi:hypothetical protein
MGVSLSSAWDGERRRKRSREASFRELELTVTNLVVHRRPRDFARLSTFRGRDGEKVGAI